MRRREAWEQVAWEQYAAAALTMAASEVFRPVYVAKVEPEISPDDRRDFEEQLSKLSADTMILPPGYDVDVRRPDRAEIAKIVGEIADAMIDEERKRFSREPTL